MLDSLNRTTGVVQGALIESFAYDAYGRRIRKTSGATTSNYLYQGDTIYAEYSAANATYAAPTAVYTHGPNTDDPLLRLTGTIGPNATVQYYHKDGLGSVVGVSNAAGGTDATARYDAWGSKTASTGITPQYGYTGREPDATGLVYYRARYYAPSQRRFTQRDPIGFRGGINRYAYVNNNPINYTDPSGELMSFTMNALSRDPMPYQDVTRISSFSNAVALTGTTVAAAPFIAGITAPGTGTFGFAMAPALTSGTIGGVTGALGALNTGGGARDMLIGGVVGFGVGVLTSPLSGSGFWANAGKGGFSGFAGSSLFQSLDIGTSPTKTFSQDFNTGAVIGSTIGGGFAGGITAPFGKSAAEQISAAVIGYGPATAGEAVGEAMGWTAPPSQSLSSFAAPVFNGSGYTTGGGTSWMSRSK